VSGDKPVTFDDLTALPGQLRESDDLATERAMAMERIARGAAISLDDARRMNAGQPLAAAAAQLQDGDVLVLRTDEHLSDEMATRIGAAVTDLGRRLGRTLYSVVLDRGLTLETIPAARLRQLGWVRADARLVDLEDDQR
jgi:hypothetical protein